MVINIEEFDSVLLEHILIPGKLPDLHGLAFLLEINLVGALAVLEHGLHEHDEATGLDAPLHT